MNKLIFGFCFLCGILNAQKMSVQRCADIDRKVPITNIHIDGNGNKWVADNKGLFLAQSPDYASIIDIPNTEWSLLTAADGNEELSLSQKELQQIMGEDFEDITTANLNKKKNELWIGTMYSGVYQLGIQPKLELIQVHHKGNSKLRSNKIQTIQSSIDGRVFIGTEDGLLLINEKKSDLIGKFFSINTIEYYSRKIWVLSDGEIYEVDEKGNFLPFDLDPVLVDNQIIDIAFDEFGYLWIASDIVARFDREHETYDLFGPAQNFTSQNVNRIAVDNDNALWVGTSDKGVYYIGESSTLSATVVVQQPLGCNSDAKDAALIVRASGGEPPYSYEWTGGANGENPKNLGPGEYIVTVVDKNGNEVKAKSTIKDTRLELQLTQERPASSGGGSDGKAVVEVTNSQAAFTYKWDNGETKRRASGLNTGLHTVTITDPRNGCTTIGEINISESLAPLAVSLTQVKENLCNGESKATIEAMVQGGQAPYQYTWEGMILNQSKIDNLKAGTYRLTVTDTKNNKADAEIRVIEPKVLSIESKVLQSANTNMADGQATVAVEGGSSPYTYAWSSNESGVKAIKLSAGEHEVTVTDANNCVAIASVMITEDILPLSVEIVQSGEIRCSNEQSVNLAAQISGGKSPFTYEWSTGGSNNTINNVGAGDYQVTITDAVNTVTNATIRVTEPGALTSQLVRKSAANSNASDGKATINVSGGTGKYTYLWDNGETTPSAKNLSAGQHTVTITDEAGCATEFSTDINEDILPLSMSLQITSPIKCYGDQTGEIQLEYTGGKAPFNFSWNKDGISGTNASGLEAGTYTVTVTDAANNTQTQSITIEAPTAIQVGISQDVPAGIGTSDGQATVQATGGAGKFNFKWDNGETTIQATKLNAGQHSVTVIDNNGCQAVQQIEISENILPLEATINQTAVVNCKGDKTGALELITKGGKPPYQIQWNQPGLDGKLLQNLAAGTYSVTLTDANGSSKTAQTTFNDPNQLIASLNKNRPATYEDSEDGRAIISVKGGTPEFKFEWDNGETGKEAKKLKVGLHSVTITDGNNCQASVTFETKKRINPEITAETLRPGQKLQVSQLYFDADSTEAKPESYPALDEIADFLKENTGIKIEVGGHTNNVPPDEYCDKLSTARANSVATYIVKQGVPEDRVYYRGYGKREPKYTNRTEDGRRRNQRVEIKVLEVNAEN